MADKVFRPLVLILLLAILGTQFWIAGHTSRYQFNSGQGWWVVLDTRTGYIYFADSTGGVWREVHPQTGQFIDRAWTKLN